MNHDTMTVTFWGVRGSLASAGADIAQVGGNTSCVQVEAGREPLILDAGTGIRGLGAALLRAPQRPGPYTVHLLLSHYHWDHIQGLPFFLPAYRADVELHIHGPRPTGPGAATLDEVLARQMQRPFFPVGPEAFRARLVFHELAAGEQRAVGDAVVTAAATNHPGGGLAYRIERGGVALVYATDTEHDHRGLDERLARVADDANLLVYDAQYTTAEYASKVGWGHSTAAEGVRLAQAARVPQLALFHHDPAHDDWTVAAIEAEARALFPGTFAAREGRKVVIGAHAGEHTLTRVAG